MTITILKRDLFGRVELHQAGDGSRVIQRNLSAVHWWIRPVAGWLAGREARALAALGDTEQTPRLCTWDGKVLERSWIDGQPMHLARPDNREYFRSAFALLCQLHRAGIAHNDLAKEPNWLVTPDNRAAVVDFQLASFKPRRGAIFRLMAREDLRHYLKHKRTYRPQDLTMREKGLLARPAWPSRAWMATAKPVYLFVTRRLMGWADREGAGDR